VAVILVIANPSDPATRVGYYYLRRFSIYASQQGHQVIFQRTPTLDALRKAITTYDPKLVVANGHGGYRSLAVDDNVIIGSRGYDEATKTHLKNENVEWFRNRIVILATCNAGRQLAYDLIEHGAVAVLGYSEPFIFMSDDTNKPDKDKSARPFFISLLQPALKLASGATFAEACSTTRASYTEYQEEEEAQGDEASAKYLNFDRENLVCLGDPMVRL